MGSGLGWGGEEIPQEIEKKKKRKLRYEESRILENQKGGEERGD